MKELCCAINEDFLQIKREGNDANEIFKCEKFRVFRGSYETSFE